MNTQTRLLTVLLLPMAAALQPSIAATLTDWQPGDACPGGIVSPISVRSFGAIPNDTLDDTAAMQRAADFLCECGAGMTLKYPAGHYDVKRLNSHKDIIQADPRKGAIAYVGCRNVSIVGPSAVIDVRGNFRKQPAGVLAANRCADPGNPDLTVDLVWASAYSTSPFEIVDSRQVRIRGFEINGHVGETTIEPGYCYQEGHSHSIAVTNSSDFQLSDLRILASGTDGIYIAGRDGAISGVTVSNSARNALSLTEARNIRVTQSTLRDSGWNGTRSNSYSSFSQRGVAFEPEALPDGADWKVLDDPSTEEDEGDGLPAPSAALRYLPGNFLFDRVTITGNKGGQVSLAHPASGANVTIRRSILRNVPGNPNRAIEGGIAGVYVQDCDIDTVNGLVWPNYGKVRYPVVVQTSPGFSAHLADLAADPSPYARGVFREARYFSSTRLLGNRISGEGVLLHAEGSHPLLMIRGNTFTGRQTAASIAIGPYRFFGFLSLYMGPAYDPTPHPWTDSVSMTDNRVVFPGTLPPRDPSVGGEVYYNGVTRLSGNSYLIDPASAPPAEALSVTYDRIPRVTNDQFPTTGAIVPYDYVTNRPYALGPTGLLNLP
ncbi:MAG: hypothetical protein FJ189_10620 [Gammaproteobacteria bacterium]|nr:hypothetical protein [Gammaproteobacteria bacterium]